jgi:NAD(P)H-hydrate epimerase
MRLVTPDEMKQLEETANNAGYTYAQMMQKAGEGIANVCLERFPSTGRRTVIGLIGGGNNGGDTLIALTGLQKQGWDTQAVLLKQRNADDTIMSDYKLAGGKVVSDYKEIDPRAFGAEVRVVLDGALGTGFRPPMAVEMKVMLEKARKAFKEFMWVAVDCPSGVDCSSGEVSTGTSKASCTICLEAVKTGLMTPSAFPYCGEILSVDLGISAFSKDTQNDFVVDRWLVKDWLPQRDDFSHKGNFGKVMVAGGSANYPGAPVLAGKGAYAVGTGLVQVAVPQSIAYAGMANALELTWLILEDGGGIISELAVDTLRAGLASCDCLVLGPGIGREETTRRFVQSLVYRETSHEENGAGFPGVSRKMMRKTSSPLPVLVLDADALAHLATDKNWYEKLQASCVLTPHPGEMALLTRLKVEEIQANRLEIARERSRLWGQVVVLKGALSVVASPSGQVGVVPVASSALAKAGTGDVLAGMIGGLIAQGLSPWKAALCGTWLHAQAGLAAAAQAGCSESVLASTVLNAVPEVFRKL